MSGWRYKEFRQLINFHERYNNLATICVKRHEVTIPFGVINCEGIELKRIEEKPSYEFLINAGVYVIDPILYSYSKETEKFRANTDAAGKQLSFRVDDSEFGGKEIKAYNEERGKIFESTDK